MTDVLEHLKKALADRYEIEREIGRGGMGIHDNTSASRARRCCPRIGDAHSSRPQCA